MKTRKAFFQENPPEVNFILYPSTTQPFLFKEKERPLKKKEREEERALQKFLYYYYYYLNMYEDTGLGFGSNKAEY